MALKFSANLSTLFFDIPIIQRFEKAKLFGFHTYEIQNPYIIAPEILELEMKKNSLQCDLINLYPGPGNFGCAAHPVNQSDFFNATQMVIPYHKALNFKKLHILSGEKQEKFTDEDHLVTYISNLNSLVSSDYLENFNVTGLIEPVCNETCQKYFLNSFETAIEVIKTINSNQIKLLLDIYHLHKITGNVPQYLEKYYPYAGHIQVSQDPGRKEPLSEGNIDYLFVFDFLRRKNHQDYIGLEYYLSGSKPDSFQWIKNYQIQS